jgi:hypothetical protein
MRRTLLSKQRELFRADPPITVTLPDQTRVELVRLLCNLLREATEPRRRIVAQQRRRGAL